MKTKTILLLFIFVLSISQLSCVKKEVGKCDVTIYKVYSEEQLVELFGNQSMQYADAEYGLGSLFGKIKRGETVKQSEDTTKYNEVIYSTKLPQGIKFKWITTDSNLDLCNIVFYNANSLFNGNISITKIEKSANRILVDLSFPNKRDWEKITTDNVNGNIAISINGVIVQTVKITQPISGGKCQVALDKEIFKKVLPNIYSEELEK